MKEMNNKELIEAVMAKTRSANSNAGSNEILKQQTLSRSFDDIEKEEQGPTSHSGLIPVFHQNEETKGSAIILRNG